MSCENTNSVLLIPLAGYYCWQILAIFNYLYFGETEFSDLSITFLWIYIAIIYDDWCVWQCIIYTVSYTASYLYSLVKRWATIVGGIQGCRNWLGRLGNCWTKVFCTSREPTIGIILALIVIKQLWSFILQLHVYTKAMALLYIIDYYIESTRY